MPRIILIHPYRPSMPPIEAAFAQHWPEAELLSLLDESLYADVTPEGVMQPSVPARIKTLFEHAVQSGAKAVVFTGSTFGPAVDWARIGLSIPVLKADEAMAHVAAARGGRALLVCTAARALPVLIGNLNQATAARGKSIELSTLVVPDAKSALVAGEKERHDTLIAQAISAHEKPEIILLGQVSMTEVVPLLAPELQEITLTSPNATVSHLKQMLLPLDGLHENAPFR